MISCDHVCITVTQLRKKIQIVDISERDGAVCHKECSSLGCWGPDNNHCLSCKKFQYGDLCLSNCTETPGLYQVNASTCDQCDVECKTSCTGAVSALT